MKVENTSRFILAEYGICITWKTSCQLLGKKKKIAPVVQGAQIGLASVFPVTLENNRASIYQRDLREKPVLEVFCSQ